MTLPVSGWGFALRGSMSLGINVAAALLNFTVAVLLARLLGTAGYGLYAYVFSILILLAIPAQMGLPALVVRETAKAAQADDPGMIRGLWAWAHGCVLAISALIFAGLLIWFTVVDPASEAGLVTLCGAALVPLLAVGNIRGAALRGLGHVLLGQLPEQVLRPLMLVALIGGSVVAGWSLTAASAMVLHAVAATGAFTVGTVLLVRAAQASVRPKPRTYAARAWANSAVSLGLIAGLHVVNANVDLVMLGTLRPFEEVGIYRVASTAAGIVALGLMSINTLITPAVASAYAAGKTEELQRLVTASARLVLVFAVPVFLVLLLFGTWFLETAFGAAYGVGYPALVVLILGQLANAAFGQVALLLNMTGHERDTLFGVAVAATANVCLNFLLIPAYGLLGAAAASCVTLLCWNALLYWRVWKRIGINSTAFRLRA